ncbi:hypothetical protein BV898_08347 [Hypsibius exemplaris]|uniref:Glycosyltransferase family 92 protein n=1 Tax=Hypsibius exemplaris TaxID=2072580 RepID=A0A1W0WQU0_HYPEX|nr:hypothetical protein BV898_08347 [Hypsibius exemplaris]
MSTFFLSAKFSVIKRLLQTFLFVVCLAGLITLQQQSYLTPQPDLSTEPYRSQQAINHSNKNASWRTVFPGSLYVLPYAQLSAAFATPELHITAVAEGVPSYVGSFLRGTIHCKCEFFPSNRGSPPTVSTDALLERYAESQLHGRIKYASGRFRCALLTPNAEEPDRPIRFRLHCRRGSLRSLTDFTVPNKGSDVSSPSRASVSFAYCSAPIWGGFNDAAGLVEFLEYYRWMGVERFIFYVHDSAGPAVVRVLACYEERGLVETVRWTLPVRQDTVWYQAQLAALHDCFASTAGRWDYTLNVDLDEFVATTQQRKLSDLVETSGESDCLMIRSSIMPVVQPDLLEADRSIGSIRTMSDVTRKDYVYPNEIRSKFLCRAEKVQEMGIHHVLRASRGMTNFNFTPQVALLFHYRSTENLAAAEEDKICLAAGTVVDDRARRIAKQAGLGEIVEKQLRMCAS